MKAPASVLSNLSKLIQKDIASSPEASRFISLTSSGNGDLIASARDEDGHERKFKISVEQLRDGSCSVEKAPEAVAASEASQHQDGGSGQTCQSGRCPPRKPTAVPGA